MANMIPNRISENSSNGEKKIFQILKQLPKEYTVLHSLKLLEHQNKVEGEVDFVVICPRGILCIEVKGGRVRREEGIWKFINKEGKENTKVEGPYEQAAGNMYSLMKTIKEKFGKDSLISQAQFTYAVAFPDIEEFKEQGPDIELAITIDQKKIEENEIENIIKEIFQYHMDKYEKIYHTKRNGLSEKDINKLATYLRGNFGYAQSLIQNLKETEKVLIKLTEEQKALLKAMEENERMLIKGPGGTGKTVLLYEEALRQASLEKQVIYLCYNRVLSEYLNSKLEKESQEIKQYITITNLHSFLLQQIKKQNPEYVVEGTDEFFSQKLPNDFQKIECETFDIMIIDEAQDLLTMEYFLCMEQMLKNGLKDGIWYMALDRNQNIYNHQLEDMLEMIEKEIRPGKAVLTKNCRNTKQISMENKLLTQIEQSVNQEAEGEKVEMISYDNLASQRMKLKKIIKRLRTNGIENKDIAILSKHSYEDGIFKGENFLKDIAGIKIVTNYRNKEFDDNYIKYSTIHSFKGLESKIILLCDVEEFQGNQAKILNYIAMSRAKLLLYIFYDQKAQKEYEEIEKTKEENHGSN